MGMGHVPKILEKNPAVASLAKVAGPSEMSGKNQAGPIFFF
jgi:hypothetical protein